jgi:hypothetical protein
MRGIAGSGTVVASFAAMLVLMTACGTKDTANQDSLAQAKAAAAVPDIKVAEVQLGKSIGADMKVAAPAAEFSAKDTVYVSVATTGSAQNASLMLVVSPLSGVADSSNTIRDNKTISPNAPAVTEFHFVQPAGMKVGKYKAEVFLNGGLADVKEFDIIKAR